MNLSEALALAEKGRVQSRAAAESNGGPPPPARPREEPSEPDPEIVPRLERGEFDEWVDDVAQEMFAATCADRHWYDASDSERARWRKLARLAILAVSTANVRRTLRRIRTVRHVGPIDDLRGRERAAGLNPLED